MNLSDYLDRIIESLENQLGDEQTVPDFDPRVQFDPRFDGRQF